MKWNTNEIIDLEVKLWSKIFDESDIHKIDENIFSPENVEKMIKVTQGFLDWANILKEEKQ